MGAIKMKTDRKIIVIPDFFIFLRVVDINPNKSVTELQLMTTITYSHLHQLKKTLKDMGLIEIIKDSVRTLLVTTEKGKKVVEKINALLIDLGINEDDLLEYRRNTKHKSIRDTVENKSIEETDVLPIEQIEQ